MEAPIQKSERGGGRPGALDHARCRRCGDAIDVGERLWIGEVLDCPACGEPHEVAGLDPPRVEAFRRIEEDPEDFQDFQLL